MKSKIAIVLALIVGLFVGFSIRYAKVNQASYQLGYNAGTDAVWHEAFLSGNAERFTVEGRATTGRRFIVRNTLYNPPEGRDTKHGYLTGLNEQITQTIRVMKEDIGLEDNPNR